MWKEITNSMETSQPFTCSDGLIEQGVDSFRPILEKAGVFGPMNKNVISHRKPGARIKHGTIARFKARAKISKRDKVLYKDDN